MGRTHRLILTLAALLVAGLSATASVAAASVHPAAAAEPGPVIVTSKADSGPGSLRAALGGLAATETREVRFAPDVRGEITLTAPLRVDAGTFEVVGPGPAELRLSGGNSNRIFVIEAGAGLTLSGLTLSNGRATARAAGGGERFAPGEGGAVMNRGRLTLTGVHLLDNAALGSPLPCAAAYGGAIFNRGRLNVIHSLLRGNVARGSDDSPGARNCQETSGSGESRGGSAHGGAIQSEGSTDIRESELRDNSALGGVGSAPPQGPFGALNTHGGGAFGGAVFVGSRLSSLWLEASTLAANTARGGLPGAGTTLERFSGDAAGGGLIAETQDVVILRSTIVANVADSPAPQFSSQFRGRVGAGGVELLSGGRILRSNTIVSDPGRAAVVTTSPVQSLNSIVESCAGAGFKSLGFNLDYGSGCGFDAGTDLRDTNARLGALGNNGGPTRTMPLTAESPAIDAGFSTEGSDQRGDTRPFRFSQRPLPPGGNGADIGAYELLRLPRLEYELAPKRLSFSNVAVGTVSKYQELTLRNSGDVSFRVGTVSLEGRHLDEFSISSQDCAGAELRAGTSCRVRVRFLPEELGTRSAELNLRVAVEGGPLIVPLSGDGI